MYVRQRIKSTTSGIYINTFDMHIQYIMYYVHYTYILLDEYVLDFVCICKMVSLEPQSPHEDFDISHAQIGHSLLTQEQTICRGINFL